MPVATVDLPGLSGSLFQSLLCSTQDGGSWLLLLDLPLVCSAAVGKLHHCSVPQFLHMQNGELM